jgi:hypothetical protein
LEARIAELAKVLMVDAGTFAAKPESTHRLHRGDPMLRRDEVKPNALSAVPGRIHDNRSDRTFGSTRETFGLPKSSHFKKS